MSTYRVTIHKHIIYDYVVDASSREEAVSQAEDTIVDDAEHLWREDQNAGWTEIGAVYDDVGLEV